MRAALLPTPGNPFLIEHWLRNFEQVWQDEVDELIVNVNGQTDPAVREAIREAVERRGARYIEGATPEHGLALKELVDATEADYVMLCEDDCRVRLAGEVAARFARLESDELDVIGSPRGSMTPGIHARATDVLPKQDATKDSRGYQGLGMWPAFVFARRSCLLDTDQRYGAAAWEVGDDVLGLDFKAEQYECADTFGSTAFQLRAKFRVLDDVQYKGPFDWQGWIARGHVIPWFHAGSLSSFAFNGPYMNAAAAAPGDEPQWGHRFAWWWRCYETTDPAFAPWRETYATAWEEYRQHIGIHVDEIDLYAPLLDQMVTWDERAA